jgi:diguanylate cyclase (GGDEF)-like protein
MKSLTCDDTLKSLHEILEVDSSLRGLEYLKQICLNIYKHFESEYIIIGKTVQPDDTAIETIIALVNGTFVDNFSYELQNSPCENVCTTKRVCVYENDVIQEFGKHSLITDLGIEAYVGSPLMKEKKVFGLLVFLESKAIEYPEYYKSLISILSSCISLEIERHLNDAMVISLQQANLKLNNQNQTDTLTNIYNRHAFSLHVEDLLHKGVSGALLFFDLDDFKAINDSHGHQTGDEVLQYFAKTVQKTIRKHDVFARYGGEEFVLFLPDADREIAFSITQRVHANLEHLQENTHKITVSIGAYVMEGTIQNLDILIKYADVALYEAKMLGKNQTVFA